MERLPPRANFLRAKTLWEIGLHVAADPSTPYGGDRDMSIVVGNGSGADFRPALRLATGSPILAEGVVRGTLDMAFVNPSGLLTQAYRGTGLFAQPLPVRVVAVYPSWDRFVFMLRPGLGISSLAQVKEERYPLRLSIREDPTHSTRVLTDQLLALYGFSLADLVSWGGSLQENGPPFDRRRMAAMREGRIDAILDEGVPTWFAQALALGWQPLTLEGQTFQALEAVGWRRVVIPAGTYPGLQQDYTCLDYSGWPLYTRADMDDRLVYSVCEALLERADEIPWEAGAFSGIDQLGRESEATPVDVPFHPAAERWFREHRDDPRLRAVTADPTGIGSDVWMAAIAAEDGQ